MNRPFEAEPVAVLAVRRARRYGLLAVVIAAFAASSASAQAPQPLLHCVFPAGGQRGRTLELTLTGANLQNAISARISGPGVTTKVIDASKPDALRISVSIALSAPLGERDIRVQTAGGVSNRYRFMIGGISEIDEVEPNSDKGQAQRLGWLPILINGRVLETDRDYFRFSAKAGQTIVCALQGRTLLPFIPDAVPGWLDACLTLHDADGREIDEVDDFWLKPDPVLVYTSPKDAEYILEVRDILFRGRNTFIYRLSVGSLPFVTNVFPLGGQRNSPVSLQVRGVNLPWQWLQLPVPADGVPYLSLGQDGRLPTVNNLPFALDDLPEVQEAEANNAAPQANRIESPCVVNGRIQDRDDNDYYIVSAQAGQTLVMEVQARRLGSPLDSMLYLYNAQRGELSRNDDWVDPSDPLLTHHADSRIVYTFPAAGDFMLRIKDVQQHGGEEYAYRLLVTPPGPDFLLQVAPDNPRLTKGDTAVVTVKALRRDGFPGEIALAVQNLPAGFTASGAIIPAGQEQARLSIAAGKDVPVGIVAPSIVGTAALGTASVTRTAFATEDIMQAFTFRHLVPTKELALAVMEPALLTLATNIPPQKPWEVYPGTDVQVVVKAIRHGDAKGEVSLALSAPPPWVTVKAPTSPIPADKDEGPITLSIAKQAPVGQSVNLFVTGTLNTGKESATRFAPAVPIRVLPAQ